MTSRQVRPAATPGPRTQAGRRISPGLVFIAVALVGSVVYLGYAITVRDASQIPLLASGAVVLAIVFGALAVYSLRATWRAGNEGRGGRALLIALVGGGAAIAAAASLAGALILFQLSSAPA
ncbi:MAG TPA: hypothetical protein VD763_12655 [Candidatus Saccharimonadales bacterium]|nr:hypothetical protein [Candidatus Saccharimonadales bacterium]